MANTSMYRPCDRLSLKNDPLRTQLVIVSTSMKETIRSVGAALRSTTASTM
jgi:hypothetical protein